MAHYHSNWRFGHFFFSWSFTGNPMYSISVGCCSQGCPKGGGGGKTGICWLDDDDDDTKNVCGHRKSDYFRINYERWSKNKTYFACLKSQIKTALQVRECQKHITRHRHLITWSIVQCEMYENTTKTIRCRQQTSNLHSNGRRPINPNSCYRPRSRKMSKNEF